MASTYSHRSPYNFLGLTTQPKNPKLKVEILPVPYDATTSYQGGAREGPGAIIDASRQIELYDVDLKFDATDVAVIETLPALDPSTDGPKAVIAQIEPVAKDIIKRGSIPFMIGGEHSITLGVVRPLKRIYGTLSVLQIDAHTDLRNSYAGSRYNHACIMRRIWDSGCDVVSAGIRSGTQEHMEFLKNKKAVVSFGDNLNIDTLVKALGDNVYITIDLDGFDASIVPATGTPEPDGLSWKQVTMLLKAVIQEKNIVGADVVELAPIPGQVVSDFVAARLVYKMIGYLSNK